MSTELTILDDRYRLEGSLGAGSQGETFAAYDLVAQRAVALKLIHAGAAGPTDSARLLGEFEHLASLRHPHLLQVHEVGRVQAGPHAGRVYFVAERLASTSLTATTPEALLEVAAALAAALAVLHAAGIEHRDVKPDNVGRGADGAVRLFDLGLAGTAQTPSERAGSLPYAAPERFLGAGDWRADLYSLGATLIGLRGGRAPLWQGRPLWLVAPAALGAVVAELLDGLPTPLVNLVASLVARDPQARPHDAEEVGAAIARLQGRPFVVPRRTHRPPLHGRRAALETALATLDLARGSELVLRAAPGLGLPRFLDELTLRLRLDALATGRQLAWHDLGAPERRDVQSLADADAQRRQLASAAWQKLRQPDTIVCLRPGAPAELVELARRGGLRPAATIFVQDDDGPAERAPTLRLEPLEAADAAALLASVVALSPAAAAPLLARAQGAPGTLVTLARRVAVAAVAAAALDPRAVEALLDAGDAVLLPDPDSPAEALLFVLSCAARPVPFAELAGWLDRPIAAVIADAGGLQRRNLVGLRAGEATALRPGLAAPLGGRPSLRARAGALLERGIAAEEALFRAALQLATGDDAGAIAALLAPVAPPRRAVWDRLAATALGRRDSLELRQRVVAQRLLESRYSEALALLPAAQTAPAALRLLAAEILLRLSRGDEASALLRGLPGEAAAALRGRAHFQHGAWREALAEVATATTLLAAVETRALAQIYLGEFAAAADSVTALLGLADTAAARARARSIQGMVAHLRGELATAEGCFKTALELAIGQGDLHSEAVYTANLAAARREQGHLAEAVVPTERAIALLRGFGRPGELALALLNAANLELSLGDLDRAAPLASEARSVAERAGDGRAAALATNLAGDLAARRGELPAATAAYEAALAGLSAPADRLVVAANLVDIAVASANESAVRAAVARLAALTPDSAVGRLRQARGTAAALLAGVATEDPLALGARLAAAAAEVAGEGRLFDSLRGQLMGARLGIDRGAQDVTRMCLQQALTTWEQIVTHIPKARLADASTDPDVVKLQKLGALIPAANETPLPAAAPPEPAVTRLLEIVKRLNSELRLELLLEFILDAATELVSAERGFLLLDDGTGKLQIATARNLDRDDLLHGPAEYSRSIAERAAQNREVIVSLDAVEDRRFESSRSVAALQVRSVLAVPLESRSRLLGCLYLDHRLRTRAFTDTEVALVRGLADHAAVAIENARQRDEVGRLATELSSRVIVQDEELSALRREVRQGRQALELRYNYDNLVGRSPAMLELFRLLDRVTDTALPVVIYGESGTGKELVARAIHHNGSRAARPFVSESCAAIPDTLLESILFGHVRGAFTGADSERRGLFEVASGGTLFLDEVGEMSPSMQSKLLRCLQQGEVRRVGSERVVKVDVRIVVASNRDLSQLVQSGAFREDLFYRLNVVRVALPALRQRSEDIPLLVDHFLKKIAEQSKLPPRRVARSAMDRLITYAWPGNVRELENEILRAAALGGELLSLGDLSPHIAAGSSAADVSASATFDLKERVERLERALLREALDRSGGNQSKAAELLGLSRFGLTKKIKRYRMTT